MGLLHKITLASILFFSEIYIFSDENISELVTSLTQPKTIAPVVQQTDVQETDDLQDQEKDQPKVQPEEDEPVAYDAESSDEVIEPKVAEIAAKTVEPVAVASVEPKVVEPKIVSQPVAPKIVTPKLVEPVMPKIMPVTPISPIEVESQVKVATPVVAPKMVMAPTPTVSKSVAAPLNIVDVPDDMPSGLDTLNIDSSGNWLEKRIWYQKGEQLFEVVRMNLQKAADLRMRFVDEVNRIGHQIDDFYESMSFERGEIDEMLLAVMQDLQSQTEIRGGDLSSSERSIKSKVQEEQKQFDVLSKDLKLIDDLDEQIDKTMMKAFKEIDTCRGLETRTWNNFKEIGLELDDKKARVLYYEMENFHKNIEQKMGYLQNNLLPYLQNQLVAKVDQTMSQIKATMQDFDRKGLSLKTVLQKDEHGDLVILKQRDEMQAAENQQAKKAAQQKAESTSTIGKILDAVISFVQPLVLKLHEWMCIALCFVQSVFCKIQEWICQLFGY